VVVFFAVVTAYLVFDVKLWLGQPANMSRTSAIILIMAPWVFLAAVQGDAWLARFDELLFLRGAIKMVVNLVRGIFLFLIMPLAWFQLLFVNPLFVRGGQARRVEMG